MSSIVQEPLVSIITPSFNAARFIERTIESVLAQDYPNVEYIVMDGGSSDGTVALLEQYRDRLQYVSAPDNGPADAVNHGFQRSSGRIFAWLNADDTYLPGALGTAVRRMLAESDAAVAYGEGYWTDDQGNSLGRYPTMATYNAGMFARECPLCQPACFIRREAFESAGMLDPALRSAFDYDLWIRLSRRYRFVHIPEYLATSRMHPDTITLRQRDLMFQESIDLLQRHYGYVPVNWIYAYLSFRRDRRDQFFAPLQPSPLVYFLSLPVGSCYNYKHLWRYWTEWIKRPRPPGS